jgi:hypothetical protein
MVDNKEIDRVVKEAREIAAADYRSHEPTARNHAALQALQIKINGELIKTIRSLDAKNAKLQKLLFLLSVVATFAAIVALLK